MERQHIDIICMAVPSEAQAPGLLYQSHGKGYEYFALLCQKGGSYRDFEANCHGGRINEQAKTVVQTISISKRPKDDLRNEVRQLIIQSVRKFNFILE
jgi:hypothetical protein